MTIYLRTAVLSIHMASNLLRFNFLRPATRDCQNKHNLQDIQKRLDTGPFDRSIHPLAQEFKNLDVTQRGELIHEGDLEWRLHRNQVNIKLRVLLFRDFILLLTRSKAGTAQNVSADMPECADFPNPSSP